jgi:hypothetical protein
MLSNFETAHEKLIQIILCGQPQLGEKIASPGLEQLRQRVSIFAYLQPFSREDVELYIDHRLRIAGYSFETPLFTPDALALIAEASEGIPRNINNLCFNSISLGCASRLKTIDRATVREVIADLDIGQWLKKSPLPVPPEHGAPRDVPAFLSPERAVSPFAGWMPKVALGLLVAFILGGTLFASLWWPRPTAASYRKDPASPTAPAHAPQTNRLRPATPTEPVVQAHSTVLPTAAADPSSSSTKQAPQPGDSTITVNVTPGRTLLGICVENFGKCNPALLEEIRKLNPRLSNPDHIETGQKIRIPGSGLIAEQPVQASMMARDAQ